ncbi:MAG: class C sortase, partial [Oscillospiraceae bacterium]|nr:class C sortase [Oscillospiraceae bacterium]
MKNFLINTVLLLIFLAGMGLLLYPSVSNMINERNQSTVITQYKQESNELEIEERKKILENARTYNQNLPTNFAMGDSEDIAASDLYNNTLNAGGNGVMGVLQIDKINVNLPIYHGTSESVLQVAVGHLPATSLPVGG